MVERDVTIRLRLKDGEKVENRLKKLGVGGQRALAKIERSSKPASKSLLALNAASGRVQLGMGALAGRAGGLGNALGALGPAGLGVGAAMGTAALAMNMAIRAAREAVVQFSDLANTADKLGVTVESLQELRFAAEQVGVSSQTMDLAMQRFTRRLAEAQQGAGELKPILDQYNIAIRDAEGNSRSAAEVLGDLADAAAGAEKPQERLRIAFKAFDSEGAALVNLLRQGREGLEGYAAQARATGAVVEDHIVQKARDTGDELNRLDQQNRALMSQIGVFFADWHVTFVKVKNEVLAAINDILDLFRDLDELSSSGIRSEMDDIDQRLGRWRERLEAVTTSLSHVSPAERARAEAVLEGRGGSMLQNSNDQTLRLLKQQAVLEEKIAEDMARRADLQARLDELAVDRRDREDSVAGGGTGVDVDSSAETDKVADVIKGLEDRLQVMRLEAKGAAGELAAAQARSLQQAGLFGAADTDARAQKIRDLVAAMRSMTEEEQRLKQVEQDRAALIDRYTTAEERRQKLLADAPALLKGAKQAEEILARIRKDVERERLDAATDFSSGVKRAFRDMAADAEDAASVAEDAIKSGMSGAQDAIKGFVRTGKLDLASLGDVALDIFADIAAQQATTRLINPFLSSIGLFAADGAVLSGGRVIPHSRGGLVDGPTFFPMARGNIGVMGEAGPEAIMPLERTRDGALGVRALLDAGPAAPSAAGPRIVFAPVIQIGGGQGGDPRRDRELADTIADRLRREFENMIDERVADNLRPGGMLSPFGDTGRFGY
ncbi:phage tail tape measure protein [Minwuia thermotolerans]|uniref:Bacteriophage tail tape measure C-terminal domain-containing protein n=1 Tax=Minwuia thermotolerans TaxID=2056226 RepID=A0A2M9G2P5_9PROT|nr:phage tail tape measure C-terminal domain-containing protein [Minwuia thermotolerans]PJK29964.1 hypothetical protein CVT23_09360 [Minwuia thermotolerans]